MRCAHLPYNVASSRGCVLLVADRHCGMTVIAGAAAAACTAAAAAAAAVPRLPLLWPPLLSPPLLLVLLLLKSNCMLGPSAVPNAIGGDRSDGVRRTHSSRLAPPHRYIIILNHHRQASSSTAVCISVAAQPGPSTRGGCPWEATSRRHVVIGCSPRCCCHSSSSRVGVVGCTWWWWW